jgi:hypothetical protein
VAAFLAIAGCEPILIVPGGALSGPVAPAPADWSDSASVDTIQLETRGDDPYSVNIWGVDLGADFYIAAASGAETRWAHHITDDADVRVRIAEQIYELRAMRVTDQAELERVMARYIEKYEIESTDNFVGSAWVYRLERRE